MLSSYFRSIRLAFPAPAIVGRSLGAGIGFASLPRRARETSPVTSRVSRRVVTLSREWARAHPEEFARAGINEFSSMVGSFDEAFDQLLDELQETENGFREMLAEPEFKRQASDMLRSRVEDAAKMVHAMKLQAEAAAEAIHDAVYESDEGERH